MTSQKPGRRMVALAAGAAILVLLGPGRSEATMPIQDDAKAAAQPEAGSAKRPKPPAATPASRPLPPRPGESQEVFEIQHVDPKRLAQLLAVFPARISAVDRGGIRALAVSAKPAVLAAIGETIKRLDQPEPRTEAAPRPSVEVTCYLLEGLPESIDPAPLPPALDDVIAQLRRTFRFPAYRLIDTVGARSREGSSFKAGGVVKKLSLPLADAFYELKGNAQIRSADGGRIVMINRFDFTLQVPAQGTASGMEKYRYTTVGLKSDLDVREGHYVVVGKSGLGDSDNALLVVVSATIID